MEKFESEYFLTYFLKGLLGMQQGLSELPAAFQHLSGQGARAEDDFFLHRDFQSRNLIVNGDRIGVVDWQGGRLGPLQYDLASLLIDPYVELTKEEQADLFDYYLSLLERRLPGASFSFTTYYPYLAIQRNLQILGAFSYLSKIRGKTKFLEYVSPSLRSLARLLQELDDPRLYPLRAMVHAIQKQGLGEEADFQIRSKTS
jgi:hypothetical protein